MIAMRDTRGTSSVIITCPEMKVEKLHTGMTRFLTLVQIVLLRLDPSFNLTSLNLVPFNMLPCYRAAVSYTLLGLRASQGSNLM